MCVEWLVFVSVCVFILFCRTERCTWAMGVGFSQEAVGFFFVRGFQAGRCWLVGWLVRSEGRLVVDFRYIYLI